MANQWESRERRVKRIALIVSVLLHVAALAMISGGTGKGGLQDTLKGLFGSDQDLVEMQADAKS